MDVEKRQQPPHRRVKRNVLLYISLTAVTLILIMFGVYYHLTYGITATTVTSQVPTPNPQPVPLRPFPTDELKGIFTLRNKEALEKFTGAFKQWQHFRHFIMGVIVFTVLLAAVITIIVAVSVSASTHTLLEPDKVTVEMEQLSQSMFGVEWKWAPPLLLLALCAICVPLVVFSVGKVEQVHHRLVEISAGTMTAAEKLLMQVRLARDRLKSTPPDFTLLKGEALKEAPKVTATWFGKADTVKLPNLKIIYYEEVKLKKSDEEKNKELLKKVTSFKDLVLLMNAAVMASNPKMVLLLSHSDQPEYTFSDDKVHQSDADNLTWTAIDLTAASHFTPSEAGVNARGIALTEKEKAGLNGLVKLFDKTTGAEGKDDSEGCVLFGCMDGEGAGSDSDSTASDSDSGSDSSI